MRLSAKTIVSYANTNNFDYGNQWIYRAGDPAALFFQVIDLDKDGHRYMVGVGNDDFSVQVIFPSLDDAKELTISAAQVDPSDSSIWSIYLAPGQTPGSGNVIFKVTEDGLTRSFSSLNMMSVEYPGNDGSC